MRQGWTADGWRYRVYWDKGDGKFKVMFTDEFKEVWVLEDVRVEKVDAGYEAFLKDMPVFSDSLQGVLFSIAQKIAYRLEHDGSWVVRGAERMAREEEERLRRLGLRPEEVRRVAVPYRELPFGSTRLVFEKAIPVIPMALAREEREKRVVERRPAVRPPKPTPRKLGLTSNVKRKLRVMYDNFLYKTGIKPTSRLRTDFYFFLDTLEKRVLTLPEETAHTEAKRETVSYFKTVYFRHYGL